MGGVESLLGGTTYQIGSHRVTKIKQLAEGGFSFVDLVRDDAQPNTQYALKRILCQTTEQVAAAKAEIQLHNSISHPFVLSLIESDIQPAKNTQIQGATEALLLFPLYQHGSIVDVIQRYQTDAAASSSSSSSSAASPRSSSSQQQPWPFPEHEALRLFYALCQGVQAIHAAGYAHRDLKPHNVLLSYPYHISPSTSLKPSTPELPSEPVPIIIDLGSADTLTQTPSDRKAAFALQERAAEHSTASYRAPELWDVKVDVPVDEKADVWSLALILYFMAFGTSAFENEQEGVMTLAIKGGTVKFPEEFILPDSDASTTVTSSSSKSKSHSSIHPTRLFTPDFVEFLREMLTADPAARLSLKDAMKKSVILMVAAVERTRAPKADLPLDASGSSHLQQGEDEFGDFFSSSSTATLTPAALDLLITDMQLGSSSSVPQFAPGGFLKFGRKGSPHVTKLQLSPGKDALLWTSKGKKVNTIPLTRIFSLVTGQITSKFERFKSDAQWSSKAHLCFSLLLKPSPSSGADEVDPTSGEETLDLLADGHQLYRTWTSGLQALLSNPDMAKQETVGI